MKKVLFANSHDTDIRYAVQANIPDAFYLIYEQGQKKIFLDAREKAAFEKDHNDTNITVLPLEVELEQAKNLEEGTSIREKLALHLFRKYDLVGESVEVPISFPLDLADFLRSSGVKLNPVQEIFPERTMKNENEKGMIRDSLVRCQKAFQRIEEILKKSEIQNDSIVYQGESLTSEMLKLECDRVLLENGMIDTEGMIISCGEHATMPHHRGAGKIFPNSSIICDIFPRNKENGYYADMTRTYVKGKADSKLKEIYETVKGAQDRAFDLIKEGKIGKEINTEVVDFFEKKGFATSEEGGFIHGTGHGLGLAIHEGPYINALYDDSLRMGNVVTVEPGLYYKGIGGVRIEDVVFVTKTGYENLTNYPKVLEIE